MKVIHQTVLTVIRTVRSPWLLRMGTRCRTAESARANHKIGTNSRELSSVLHGQITIDQLHTNSDWMVAGPEGEIENEDRITKLHSRLQGLFGVQFEILFGKLHGNVKYFVIFCNLINILDVGVDSNDAVKIKIEIRGFLQLRKPRAVTALQNLLPPVRQLRP